MACHTRPSSHTAATPDVSTRDLLASPDLTALDGNIDRDWLIDWLVSTPAQPAGGDADVAELRDDEISRRMPHFGLSPQQAADIAAALMQHSKPHAAIAIAKDPQASNEKPEKEKVAAKSSKDKQPARTKPDAAAGQLVVLTRGCLACHSFEKGRNRHARP